MNSTQSFAQYLPQIINLASILLSSFAGAFLALAGNIIFKKLQEHGRVALYARIVHSQSEKHNTWGYYRSNAQTGLYLQIPIWLEVTNTCGVPRVLRDINLYAYSNGEEVAAFTQIQCIGDTNKIILGQNEAYTVVIPEKSCKRFGMEFFLHQPEMPTNHSAFDKIVLAYYDERDIFHAFDFATVEKCWTEGALRRPKVWFRLKEHRVRHKQRKDAELPCAQ